MSAANGDGAPFDLGAAEAAAAEAGAAPFAFTYAGKPYEVPPATSWPLSALRKVGEGDLDGALRELLGDAAFDGLADDGLRLAGLNKLFEAIAAHQGLVSLPNSARPARRASPRK